MICFRPGFAAYGEQRVLEEVRRITTGIVGLPLEQVRGESDLVKDLGWTEHAGKTDLSWNTHPGERV